MKSAKHLICNHFLFLHLYNVLVLININSLVTGLSHVRVLVPDAVRSGDSAELLCHFDLEGDALYSVKWYKGRREFYRYTPRENPPTKVFPIPGLEIKVRKSNSTHLVLDNIHPGLAGRYSCEVSADAPSFHTALMSGDMDVVVTPKHRPSLQGIKHRYKVGELLQVNCTSSGSRPAANLTWFFNGEQVQPKFVKLYKTVVSPIDGLETSSSTLEIPLKKNHFSSQGRFKVRCIASLHSLYWQTTEKSAEEEKPKNMAVLTGREMADQDYRGFQEIHSREENPYFVKAAPSIPNIEASNATTASNFSLLILCVWTVLYFQVLI
uniref:Ig-like domain-containing protein n=1 Tax=Clastoptera arizonana TaxID=38151 RepID=A0A1B6CTZ7_9HEMI